MNYTTFILTETLSPIGGVPLLCDAKTLRELDHTIVGVALSVLSLYTTTLLTYASCFVRSVIRFVIHKKKAEETPTVPEPSPSRWTLAAEKLFDMLLMEHPTQLKTAVSAKPMHQPLKRFSDRDCDAFVSEWLNDSKRSMSHFVGVEPLKMIPQSRPEADRSPFGVDKVEGEVGLATKPAESVKGDQQSLKTTPSPTEKVPYWGFNYIVDLFTST